MDLYLFLLGLTLNDVGINVNFKTPFWLCFSYVYFISFFHDFEWIPIPVAPRKLVESSAVSNFGGVTSLASKQLAKHTNSHVYIYTYIHHDKQTSII